MNTSAIVADMSISDYHAHPSVSKSQLDRLAISPAHYKWPPEKQTKATAFGAALHDYVLSPDVFDATYAIKPIGFNGATKAGKELQAGWDEQGLIAVTYADFMAIKHIHEQIMAIPKARHLLSHGQPEVSHFWTDHDTGVQCRCRPDWTPDSLPWLLDLKTTTDASPRGFSRSMANYRYHVQAAFYSDGVTATTGQEITNFLFLAVEKESPYAVALYELPQSAIDLGRALYRRDLQTYADAVMHDDWPAYGQDIQQIDLPAWAYNV